MDSAASTCAAPVWPEAERDHEASQGRITVVKDDNVAALVELRCETRFVAKAAEFVGVATTWPSPRRQGGGPRSPSAAEEDQRLAVAWRNSSIGRSTFEPEVGESSTPLSANDRVVGVDAVADRGRRWARHG